MAKLTKKHQNSTSRIFHANNIPARSYVCCVRLWCLQAGSKITLTSSRHQIHSKHTRYTLRIFKRIGRKIRIFNFGRKKVFFVNKNRVYRELTPYISLYLLLDVQFSARKQLTVLPHGNAWREFVSDVVSKMILKTCTVEDLCYKILNDQ